MSSRARRRARPAAATVGFSRQPGLWLDFAHPPFLGWVPYDANPADIPSSPQGAEAEDFYQKEQLTRWPYVPLYGATPKSVVS